jgi:hypothetical protein
VANCAGAVSVTQARGPSGDRARTHEPSEYLVLKDTLRLMAATAPPDFPMPAMVRAHFNGPSSAGNPAGTGKLPKKWLEFLSYLHAEPTFLRFRCMHGRSRPTLLGRRLCDGTDAGSGRSLRAALLLLLLSHFSRLFLLPFGLTVITLGQRNPPMVVPLSRHVL